MPQMPFDPAIIQYPGSLGKEVPRQTNSYNHVYQLFIN